MSDLRRHVPPLTLTWDEESPGALWRVVDGTLVFADVSGFTALTEKLSRRGRIGAEEIVETLNRVFGPMLHIAASRGGELLKFGGDALLFLFRGEDHPRQACDAAVEMRSALRAAAAMPTTVGRLSLSMSVGVHSGEIHLFLVGAPTRELLILGPAATATAEAEKTAEAGQIVLSPATAYRIDPDATRDLGNGHHLLRRRAARTTAIGAAPLPSADPALLRTLFPQVLGDYLGPAIPDPEHRLSCIAFIRFSGTDAVLAEEGPDVLAERLHRTVSLVEESLAPDGISLLATDLDSDGGKFFLGSGIPTASEDNEGRMLRALRRIADADSPLPLQLGVNRGHVFAAEVGIAERGAYTGMGDTTNTAARITAKAPAGRVYAHPAVLEHSRTRFAVTPAGPFPMKGKAAPLLVYDVGEEIGTREDSAPGSRLPFLGRDDELATAASTVTRALGGAGGVVTVVGGTGMGKTRFVREVLSAVDRDHLIVVRAEPYGSASAYRMLRDPLRALLGIERSDPVTMGAALCAGLERLAPELLPMAPLLADVAQADVPATREVDDLDPRYRPDRLADCIIRLVEVSLPGRVVIVVEEAHWADAASATLLARVATAVVDHPWAVVTIRRGGDGGFDPGGVRIELEPLPDAVIEQLVIAATEATPLRPQEISTIVGRAEGNPLFVDEVTRIAVRSGSLDSLPESVGAALSTQIDSLLPHHRRVLRYCAVLGRSFRTEVLRLVLQSDGLELGSADLEALSAFLEPDGSSRLRFRNSLVRDAAYEGLAYRIRARLHRTAAETLERVSTDRDADAATLALHFWRAGDAARTWDYARRAGDEARRAYANADAAELFERAIEVSRRVEGVTDEDRAELYALLGDLRELAGVLDGSVEAYRRAAGLTSDPVARALVLAKRARVHQRAGSARTALRVVTQARRVLEEAEPSSSTAQSSSTAAAEAVRVRLDNLIALIRLGQEKPREAQTWAARAAEGARRIDDLDNLASALLASGHALWQQGLPGAGDRIREALGIYEQDGDLHGQAVARTNLGVLAFGAGRWGEALEWYRSSRDVALRAGMDFQAAEADLNIAEILIHQERLDEAEEVLRSAARVLRASGIEFGAVFGEQLRSRLLLLRGDLEAADALAATVVEQYLALGSALSAAEALLLRAQVATSRDLPEVALELVDEATGSAGEEAAALTASAELVRATALGMLGRVDDATRAAEDGLRAAQAQELVLEEARLLQVRARLDGSAGSADDARARALLAEMGVPA